MFSKSCEYGIRASIYIAKQSMKGRRVGIKEIADAIVSPEAFTAKILQRLTKTHVVRSIKGPNGGFFIDTQDLVRIKLWNIVFAIDGNSLFEDCSMGLRKCNASKPCPLHFKFSKIREEIRETLEKTTLKSLAEDLSLGNTYLKR